MRKIFVVLLVVLIADLVLFYAIAHRVGWPIVLAVSAASALVGMRIVKRNKRALLGAHLLMINPTPAILDGMLVPLGGVLLMLCGPISKIGAIVLLARPSRRAVARTIVRRIGPPRPSGPPRIIDVTPS